MNQGSDKQVERQNEWQVQRMRQYLLGVLPESEQLALERDFFADGATLAEMRAIESDLVDDYVRGRLAGDERRGFEQHYLATPIHVERVAFAKELLRVADEAAQPDVRQPAPARASWWTRLLTSLRAPQFALGALAATAVLLIVIGVWLIPQRFAWRQQLNRARVERLSERERARALAAEIAQQQARNAQLNAELERLRDQPPAPATTPTTPTGQPSVLSFVLLSGVRGDEQRSLRLAPATSQVRLLMKLERGSGRRYQATVRALAGNATVSPASVTASSTSAATTVAVTIPARRLLPGDYILTLSAAGDGGQTEELDRYFFRVSR